MRALQGIINSRPEGVENSEESLDEVEPFARAQQQRVRDLRQRIMEGDPQSYDDEGGEDEQEELQPASLI